MTQNPEKNLKLMLRHEEEVNIQIGLQILANYPDKQSFATALFALAYYHSDKSIRQEARTMFKQLACRALRRKVDNFYQVFTHLRVQYQNSPRKTEKKVARHLEQIADYEIIDAEELGNLTLYFTGMGFRFCWQQRLPLWSLDFSEACHLDLSGCYDPAIKQYLHYFPSITSIDLSDNQLDTFPEEILNLSDLQRLNISKNELKTLPESIINLAELEYLDASENRLKRLPNSICKFYYLSHLYLQQNLLRKLPDDIGYTNYLHTLDVSHNLLAELPYSMIRFSDYHDVQLSNNLLSPSVWATEDHTTIIPHFWVNEGEWDCDFIGAKATFSLYEDVYSNIVPPLEWNPKQASEICLTELMLEGYNQNPEINQWMETPFIEADIMPDNKEQTTYSQGTNEHYIAGNNPTHLGSQFMEFYTEDDMADFLQSQTQIHPDTWPWMYETGLRIRYIVEGEFYDQEI
ncbi:hypothetical protein BKI52_00995 [marine bacterium AO1-C]|nr:hypothetical protein BKI52_00995 [marine bacterium AO1-C]